MRIIWKDTLRHRKPRQYRGYTAYPMHDGWMITLPGNDNIYKSYTDAFNAIDEILGGHGKSGPTVRIGGQIRILGTIDDY